jgi:uncharacterized protein
LEPVGDLAERKFRGHHYVRRGRGCGVFGTFTYRSNTLGKIVTSPFSIHVEVVDGKVTYLQFLEDTYATAASFRSAGSWIVHADPTGTPIEV